MSNTDVSEQTSRDTAASAGADAGEFVASVREHLTDLSEEEREELIGGLQADIEELVAEQGAVALPDPAEYAAELRSAAGFTPQMTVRRERRGLGEGVHRVLDACHDAALRVLASLPGDAHGFAAVLRPAWWVLRAWVAVLAFDLFFGLGRFGGLNAFPSLGGWGLLALVLAVVISVQIGRGAWWPGTHLRSAVVRSLLLGLNVFALVMTPVVLDKVGAGATAQDDGVATDQFDLGYNRGQEDARMQVDEAGLNLKGRPVTNIYPYDAAGRPLVGVQLFDAQGAPIKLKLSPTCIFDAEGNPTEQVRVAYPWTSTTGAVDNVFPLPTRAQTWGDEALDANAFADPKTAPKIGPLPLTQAPPASLAGVSASTATTPSGSYLPGLAPKQDIAFAAEGC